MSIFQECDTCRMKLGAPILCDGCLWNRWAIGKMEAALASLKQAGAILDGIEERLDKEYDRRKRSLHRHGTGSASQAERSVGKAVERVPEKTEPTGERGEVGCSAPIGGRVKLSPNCS